MLSSHRIKSQEKKVMRQVLTSLALIFGIIVLFAYVGLPILARVILFVTSFGGSKNASTNTTASSSILFPPTFNPIRDATNSAKLVLSGFAQTDTSVILKVNDAAQYTIPVDKDGKFVSKVFTLKEGMNTITAVTVKDDRKSQNTATVNVQYKNEPPKLDITTPKDGDKFSGDEDAMHITGETDPDNQVTINDRIVFVNTQGKFNLISPLSNGDNVYNIVSTDNAGNETTQQLKVTYSP